MSKKLSKRIVMLLMLICCFVFATAMLSACKGCNDNTDPQDTSNVTSVTITNKTELTAEWRVGDPNRTVKVTVLPEEEADKVAVTVRSDKEDIVSIVNNNKIHAVSEGTATITVSAGDKTDSVEVTVSSSAPTLSSVTVTNKTELEADMVQGTDSAAERTVAVELVPNSFTTENTTVILTSSDEEIIAVDGMKIKPGTKFGTATITVTAGNKVTATFTVKYRAPITAPTITFKDEGSGEPITGAITAKVTAGVESILPDPEVLGSDGKNLHSELAITCDSSDVTIEYGQIKARKVAEYKIKYSVTDSRVEEGSDTTEAEITVYAYRNIFSFANNCGTGLSVTVDNDFEFETFNEAANVAGQKVTFNDLYWTQSKFDMPAGKVYYAEATFDIFGGDFDYVQPGFSHMVGDSESGRRYVQTLEVNGNMLVRNTDWMKDGVTMVYDTLTNAVNWNANAQPYVLLIDNTRGVSVNAWSGEGNTKRRTVTIAVARDGDYFYTFVNGVYICCTTPEYYRDKDTVPGLFGYGLNQVNAENNISGKSSAGNVLYLSGTDAQAKIKTLIGEHGEKIMGGYVYYADTPDNGGVNIDNSLFTNTYSAENGLGLNYTFGEGGKFISPYVFFDGNFTFEFTYKGTQGNMFMTGKSFTNDEPNANSQDPKFTAEIFQLGYMYKEDSNQGVRLDIAGNSGTDTVSYQPYNLDTSEGVKFTVKRVLAENGAYYQLFAQSVKVPTQTATRVIFYTHYVDPNVGDPRANWDQPFIPIFYADNALGTFSHVSWTTSAEIEIPQNTETFDGTAYDTPIVNVDNPDRYVRVAEGNTSSVKGDYLLVIKYTATEDKQYGIQLRIGDDYNTEWSQWGIYVGATDYYNLSLDKTGADGGYLIIRLHLTREYENSQQFWIDLGNIPGQGNGEKPVINNVSLYKVTDQPAP